MYNNFEHQFKSVESELVALKTLRSKSASALELTTVTKTLEFTLNNNGYARKFIRIMASTGSPLFSATIDKGYENDGREFTIDSYYDDTSPLAYVTVLGNSDDQTRAAQGETVVLTATLTVVSTSEVELVEVNV